jgi:proline racemase
MIVKKLFTTIETHTAGEPLRIITSGIPHLKGKTLIEKRAYFREHFDHLRKALMFEPRGHHGMYGCIMTPPISEDADFGVLFMHNEGFSPMCGHGIISVVTAAIETGVLQVEGDHPKVVIDSPAGKITAYAEMNEAEVTSVAFENIPSFVYAHDVSIALHGREFLVDIAFGGAFYAIVNAKDLGVKVEVDQLPALQKWGRLIKEQIEAKGEIIHPLETDLKGIYGVIISDEPKKSNSHLRNVTIFADDQVDRSPCGTGTSARLASLYRRGLLQVGESFIHEGIIDSQLSGVILRKTKIGPYDAVIPQIKGRAFITGLSQFVVDPSDPFLDGFLLR